ncbi:peptidylprolyl isomerase [candidate division KSB1 bacterium]|nr:peptidylprolyl isomerase [candidate division KSB1 bacterium]
MKVQKGKVISILYSLKLDRTNKLIAAQLKKPLQFLVGKKKLILGLDKELMGLETGEKKKIRIEPEDGFGLRDEHRVLTLQRSQLADGIDLHEGMILQRKTKDGHVKKGVVKSFDEQTVVVDFNHPLAGETLRFETKVVDIRDATTEEIENT